MRLSLPLLLACLLVAGCTSPATDQPSNDLGPAVATGAPDDSALPAASPAPPATQDEAVDFDGSFRPNACVVGSCAIGGIGALFHSQTEGKSLSAGTLHVEASTTSPTERLIVAVGIYECPADCGAVQELAQAEGRGPFDITVPAAALSAGQNIGVRILPVADLAVAFGTVGWTIEMTGTLTFNA